jgi:hypothetical protein
VLRCARDTWRQALESHHWQAGLNCTACSPAADKIPSVRLTSHDKFCNGFAHGPRARPPRMSNLPKCPAILRNGFADGLQTGARGRRAGQIKSIIALEIAEISWSERRDLNSGPPVPQTGALTGLRYAPPVPVAVDVQPCVLVAGQRMGWPLGL